MMFIFEIFGIATASYLVLRSIGEIAMEIGYERYRQANLRAEGKQGRADVGDRPRLRVFRPGR